MAQSPEDLKKIIIAWLDGADVEQRLVERNGHKGEWQVEESFLNGGAIWLSDSYEYRLKRKTILIDGYDVPEPLRKAPDVGTVYFHVDISDGYSNPLIDTWGNADVDTARLEAGIIHLELDDAELHGEALLSLTGRGQS